MSAYSSKFPQYMSLPIEVLWWEMDQVIIAALTLGGALLSRGGWIIWTIALLLNYFYSKMKANRPRGFIKHVLYVLGFVKMQCYPEYFEQKFIE